MRQHQGESQVQVLLCAPLNQGQTMDLPDCDICGRKQTELGGLEFGPPRSFPHTEGLWCQKIHRCVDCTSPNFPPPPDTEHRHRKSSITIREPWRVICTPTQVPDTINGTPTNLTASISGGGSSFLDTSRRL